MNEKEKLKVRLALIENAIQLAQRRQDILGMDTEGRIDRLLKEWSEVKKELERLKDE